MKSPIERVVAKLEHRDGHLIYTGNTAGDGYGRLSVKSADGERWTKGYAHRIVWENAHGPIPKGMTIDHKCRIRSCCNLDHLRLLTRGENSLDGNSPPAVNARKTHCPKGHPLSGENVYRWTNKKGYELRRCIECNRQAAKEYGRRKNEQRKTL